MINRILSRGKWSDKQMGCISLQRICGRFVRCFVAIRLATISTYTNMFIVRFECAFHCTECVLAVSSVLTWKWKGWWFNFLFAFISFICCFLSFTPYLSFWHVCVVVCGSIFPASTSLASYNLMPTFEFVASSAFAVSYFTIFRQRQYQHEITYTLYHINRPLRATLNIVHLDNGENKKETLETIRSSADVELCLLSYRYNGKTVYILALELSE